MFAVDVHVLSTLPAEKCGKAGWALKSEAMTSKHSQQTISLHTQRRIRSTRNGGQSSSVPIRAERDSGEKMAEFVRNTSRSG